MQDSGMQEFKLKQAATTKQIRIEITEVYAVGFNGGAFMIKGTNCREPAIDKKKKDEKLKKSFGVTSKSGNKIMSCGDKFSDKFVGVLKGDK